ncbi:MAG: glutamine amidotransferase [Alphaproteobacteria bacterium]
MSDKQKGAFIITQLQNEGSCTLGKILHDRGLRIKTRNAPRIDLSEIDPLRPDLLVIMGGPIGVYQQDDYPFLKDEIEILKTRLAADKPTIGICLGSQLMAAALGSKVYPGKKGKELGWAALNITQAGYDTPARHFAPEKTSMFHWHGDTFDLPAEATLLASSAQYENQIFQIGQNALGLQCHPEVRADQLKEWFVMFTGQITGKNPLVPIDDLRAQTARNIETLNMQTELFFNEWLKQRDL